MYEISYRKNNLGGYMELSYKRFYKKYSFLERRIRMRAFSYKRLFKKLIDLDMQHNELMEKANVSRSTFYKLKNGENVTTDILLRICDALDCDISEIMECIKND